MSKIAMPVAQGFEDSELSVPYERLRKAGHELTVIGADPGMKVHGKRGKTSIEIDERASSLMPESFDALVIPGGHSPNRLRLDARLVDFVRRFFEIEADVVRGRTLTSWPSVRRDLENAGATWIDRELVEDENLITSRKPEDLEAFCQAIESQLQG